MFRYVALYAGALTDVATGRDVPVEIRKLYRCPWDYEQEAREQLAGFLEERQTDYENERLLGVLLERRKLPVPAWNTPDFGWRDVARLQNRNSGLSP